MERCTVADGPARVVPPPKRLGGMDLLRTALRNPLELLWEDVYREGQLTQKLNGRTTVIVTDPDLVREVLVDRERFIKSEIGRRVASPMAGDGILISEGEHWRRQRQIAAPIFRHSEIERYAKPVLASAESEAQRLAKLPPGQQISLYDEMKHATLQAFADTALSGSYRFDVEAHVEAVNTVFASSGWMVALAILGLPERFPYPGRKRTMAAANFVRGVASEVVAARSGQSRHEDLLQALMDSRDEESGAAMNDPEIIDNLVSFVLAGYETTALALTWTFYLLSIHPEIEARVLAEIEEAGGADGIAPEQIGQLAYTRQAISEALRLYPPLPWLLRRPSGDAVLGDVKVNAKSSIVIPVYAVHRHKKLWDEPDLFNPDRFSPEATKARHKHAYLPFGSGPRICIGQGFAMLELIAVVAKILPRFRFELAGGPTTPISRGTLRPQNGMAMFIHPRQPS